MNQEALAHKIGVRPESLSRWANGVRKPKLMARMQINGFFGEEIFPTSKAEVKTVRQIKGIKGLIGKKEKIDWHRFDTDADYRAAVKED